MSTLYTFACDGTFAIVEDAGRARAKLEAGWTWMDMDAVMEAWRRRDLTDYARLWWEDRKERAQREIISEIVYKPIIRESVKP
jgi:hypothetical protein